MRNMPRRLLPREKQAVPATAAAGRVKLAVLLAAVVLFAAVLFAPTRAFCSAPASGEGEGEGYPNLNPKPNPNRNLTLNLTSAPYRRRRGAARGERRSPCAPTQG